MKPLVSWIQISDLHFGHGDASWGWDQMMVLECLRKDVEGHELPKPNFVFVTGDVAYSGNSRVRVGETASREYVDAKKWIESLAGSVGLSREAVFLVPGNHDVDRTADKNRATSRLVRAMRDGQESVDDALSDSYDRDVLMRRFKGYLDFAADFGPVGLKSNGDVFSWVHVVEPVAGLKLRLIGLNTALLAADEFDFGRLRIGKKVLSAVVYPPPLSNELVVVMSHHPLRGGWLADERDVAAWVNSHAHILLSGHVHEPDSEEIRAGSGGSIVRVAAGASHGERGGPGIVPSHGYNYAAVFADQTGRLVLRIWPRRWSEKIKQFRADVENVPADRQYSEHELRSVRFESTTGTARVVEANSGGDEEKVADFQQLTGISEASRKLLVERPQEWEIRFFSQVLTDELTKNEDLRRDWSYGVMGEQSEYYEPVRALRWISSQISYLADIAGVFSKLINEALPVAMGPPGEPGDARQLYYVASRLADGHRKAINWAMGFRRLAVGGDLTALLKLAEEFSAVVVHGVEKFSADLQSKLNELFSAGSYEGPPQIIKFTLVLESPDVEGLERELKRLRRRYKI